MLKRLVPVLLLALAGAARADATAPNLPQARVTAAAEAYAAVEASFNAGTETADHVYLWSVRLLQSQRDAGAKDATREHLRRMTKLEGTIRQLVAAGARPRLDLLAATYYHAEAEAWAAAK
jgi:hypothetical protein